MGRAFAQMIKSVFCKFNSFLLAMGSNSGSAGQRFVFSKRDTLGWMGSS